MIKVVYNSQHGGFSLPKDIVTKLIVLDHPAVKLAKRKLDQTETKFGCTWDDRDLAYEVGRRIHRHDPVLVSVIEGLDPEGDGLELDCASLKIATISGTAYCIKEHDGKERVEEVYLPEFINSLDLSYDRVD